MSMVFSSYLSICEKHPVRFSFMLRFGGPNAKAKERCVVLYNCSEKELKVDTEIPELVKVKTVKDAFTGEDTKDIVAGRVTVTLPPMGRAAYTW